MVLKPVCHTESVYMEHNECNGFTYQDPEYGLSFGSECRKVGTWEKVQVCIETPTYEEDSNIGGQWGLMKIPVEVVVEVMRQTR